MEMRKYKVYYETARARYSMVVEARNEEEASYEVLKELRYYALRGLRYVIVHIEAVGEVLS